LHGFQFKKFKKNKTMFNKFKSVLWQLFGMFIFLLCGFAGGYIYAVGEYKNAEKRAEKANLETTEAAAYPELEDPDPISQGTSETTAERLSKVKEKAKKKPAQKPAAKPEPKPAPKPVSYSAPKKSAPIAAKKAKAPTKKRVSYSAPVKVRVTPAAQKRVALSSAKIREMAIRGAERMEYTVHEFRPIEKSQSEPVVNREEK